MNLMNYINFYRSKRLCALPAVYGDKRPEVNWREYQARKPTDDEIQRWFNDSQEHNIAIVCGAVSNNLVVLDFDDMAVYNKFFDPAKIEAGTLVVKTGSGKRHVYVKTPEPIASFRIPQLKLEVRSTGNIVIAPPSLHPSGNRYEFLNSDVKEIVVVKDLEEAIWAVAETKFGVKRPGFSPTSQGEFAKKAGGGRPWRGKTPPCITKLLEGVGQGFRNEAALRLAGYFLFTRGLEISKVRERLQAWNRLNTPPLPERELELVMRSALRRGYIFGCRGLEAFCDPENCPFEEKRQKAFTREVAAL